MSAPPPLPSLAELLARLPPRLLLGTSSFSSKDWVGPLYPPGTKSGDFLTAYARTFATVEIDSTWYGTPVARTVEGWYRKTPAGFRIAAKVPKEITHESALEDATHDAFGHFVDTMAILEEKLGPLLLQFPRFGARTAFSAPGPFRDRLEPLLRRVPSSIRIAVEVRNPDWVDEALLSLLRSHDAALALIDHPSWHGREPFGAGLDSLTTDFAYIRWLGDRHQLDRLTGRRWDRVVVDQRPRLAAWARIIGDLLGRGATVLAYANNHYNGHAPGALASFCKLWDPRPGDA